MVRSLTILLFLLSAQVHAATPSFMNLTNDDVTKIVKDMSANSMLHTVMPASTLGSIFGIELGLAGGTGNSPNIDTLTKANVPGASVPYLPHAGVVGAVSIPMGITFDFLYLPQVSGDVKYSLMGLGVKYNMDIFPAINFAIKGFYTSTKLEFNQTVTDSVSSQSVNATVSYDNTIYGLQLLVSPGLPVFEPYAGLGYAMTKGNVGLSGAVVNNFLLQSGSASVNSVEFLVGFNLRLAIIVIGAEYARVFDTSTLTGKLSLRF